MLVLGKLNFIDRFIHRRGKMVSSIQAAKRSICLDADKLSSLHRFVLFLT